MKKIILTILVCVAMILSLTGCETNKNEFNVGSKSPIEIKEKGVTLSVKENTLTKIGTTLILKNGSNVDVQYGDSYKIEIKKDGEWHEINVELNFNSPAYVLKSNTSEEIKIKWENDYGKLASGNYRIIKDIYVEKDDETFETFYVSAEFAIK